LLFPVRFAAGDLQSVGIQWAGTVEAGSRAGVSIQRGSNGGIVWFSVQGRQGSRTAMGGAVSSAGGGWKYDRQHNQVFRAEAVAGAR